MVAQGNIGVTRGYGHYVAGWLEPAELDCPNFDADLNGQPADSPQTPPPPKKKLFDPSPEDIYSPPKGESGQCNCPHCREERRRKEQRESYDKYDDHYKENQRDNKDEQPHKNENRGRDQTGLLNMLKGMLEGGKFDIASLLEGLGNSSGAQKDSGGGFSLASLLPLLTNGTLGNIMNLFKGNKKPTGDSGRTINLDNYKRI